MPFDRDSATYCFTCGQAIEDPPVLHRDDDGEPCAACLDRLLEAAPALLPRVAEGEPVQRGFHGDAVAFTVPTRDDDAPEPA